MCMCACAATYVPCIVTVFLVCLADNEVNWQGRCVCVESERKRYLGEANRSDDREQKSKANQWR